MARLDYVRPGSSAEADRVLAEVQRLGRPVLNLYAELANHPAALEAFLGMSSFVRDRSTLDPQLRELSILATAQVLGQGYELKQHREVAARIGVAAAKIDVVAAGGALDALTPKERWAVEYAREAAVSRTCSDETFARMRSLFSGEEIVDLVVTAGWYHLCAVILGSLEIEPEAT